MLSDKIKFHLSLCYGDKDRCIVELGQAIEKYKNCKNPNHPKVIERIEKYQSIIKGIRL